MGAYVISLGAGIFVGPIYGILGVRSPAPPVVALVGLLGMIIGEQAFSACQTHWMKPAPSEALGNSDRRP